VEVVVDIALEGWFVVSSTVAISPYSDQEAIKEAFNNAVHDEQLLPSDFDDCFFRVRPSGPVYTLEEREDGTPAVARQQQHSGLVEHIREFPTEAEANNWLLQHLGFQPEADL
jgi:hypothetical protein